MSDCKKHYKEMYQTRMLEAPCPWCTLEQLRAENTKMQILLRNYVKAENNHDNAYDQDRFYTEDILRKERKRVYAFLNGEVEE